MVQGGSGARFAEQGCSGAALFAVFRRPAHRFTHRAKVFMRQRPLSFADGTTWNRCFSAETANQNCGRTACTAHHDRTQKPDVSPPEVEQRALYPFHENRIQRESALGLYALTNSATVIAM